MANCVNCGTKIGMLSGSYSLIPQSTDVLCTKCKSDIRADLVRCGIRDDYRGLTPEILESVKGKIRESFVSENGYNYLMKYAKINSDRFEKLPEEEKEKIRIENERRKKEEELHQKELDRIAKKEEIKRNFKQTTGYDFEGYKIVEYLGIHSGEVVLGTGIISEFSASISDLFGNASVTMASKLTNAKNAALSKLIDNCVNCNANAVIGVDIDIMTLGANMIVACANGTAVKIEPIKSEE